MYRLCCGKRDVLCFESVLSSIVLANQLASFAPPSSLWKLVLVAEHLTDNREENLGRNTLARQVDRDHDSAKVAQRFM